MGFGSIVATVLKGKWLATTLVGVALVGGGTAAMAATPAGQTVVHQITHNSNFFPFRGPDNTHGSLPPNATGTPHANVIDKNCPTSTEVKKLTSTFKLSDASSSTAVKDICALNSGTFTGKTTKGTSVKSTHPYSYEEINLLLTTARRLAQQDKTTLTDSNITTYLADALQSIGNKFPGPHFNHPGTMPGKGFYQKPTGTPEPWPTGTPGAWPIGTPKAWPTGIVAPKPTGTPAVKH